LARVHYWIGRVYSYRNEHRRAALYYEQVLAAAHESDDQELYGLASALGGRTFFLQGEFGKAVLLLEQAIPVLAQIGNWPEWILTKVSLGIALAGQGHYQEGRTQGEEALEKALELNDRTSIVSARGMTARVEFMAGDLQRMLDETRVVVNEAEGSNPLVHYMVLGFQAWAEGRLGMHETARATMAAQRVWGQALAIVNGPDDAQAEAHLQKSLMLFEEGEAVIEAARTHFAWGKVLRARGDTEAAREHLEQAGAQFQASGLTGELEQTKRLIDSVSV
jgi:tetratricopeptide (TPR) repeat protein